MEKQILDLEEEIINGVENAKRARQLYQLLSSYNAYCILLSNAKCEYESKSTGAYETHLYSECYKNENADLFSQFASDEFLSGKVVLELNREDTLFLIDNDTLLRIKCIDLVRTCNIDYSFLKIKKCIFKSYKQNVYHREPFYCDSHYEDEDAFGLFCKRELVTPGFLLDDNFRDYNNKDIREILKVQSLDEICEKINEAKNIKVKKLGLIR